MIAGFIGLGVMVAPVVQGHLGWIVGAIILLPGILIAAFAAWAVLTTLFRGLR